MLSVRNHFKIVVGRDGKKIQALQNVAVCFLIHQYTSLELMQTAKTGRSSLNPGEDNFCETHF